jgi:drug/metabolite transporter (DMT)-like permease
MSHIKWAAIIKATIAVIIWGGTFVATKVALQEILPITLVWFRFGIGLLTLGIYVAVSRQFDILDRRELPYFFLLGFLGITFHQWLQSTGLLTSQATTTAWIVASIPVFMALLGWLALKEKLSRLQILGIVLAAFGVLLVVTKGDFTGLISGRAGTFGDILIMISALNWAIFSLLSRDGLKRYPASLMIFYVMACGWLLTSLLFLIGPRPPVEGARPAFDWIAKLGLYSPGLSDLMHLKLDGWIAVLVLGFLGSGIAYIFWYDALQALPLGQAGAFIYFEPFVTVLVAWLILNERMAVAAMIGGLTIITGVWLVNRPRKPGKKAS